MENVTRFRSGIGKFARGNFHANKRIRQWSFPFGFVSDSSPARILPIIVLKNIYIKRQFSLNSHQMKRFLCVLLESYQSVLWSSLHFCSNQILKLSIFYPFLDIVDAGWLCIFWKNVFIVYLLVLLNTRYQSNTIS